MYYTLNRASNLLPSGANLIADLTTLVGVSIAAGRHVQSIGDPPQTFQLAGITYVNVTTDAGEMGWIDESALTPSTSPTTKVLVGGMAVLIIYYLLFRR